MLLTTLYFIRYKPFTKLKHFANLSRTCGVNTVFAPAKKTNPNERENNMTMKKFIGTISAAVAATALTASAGLDVEIVSAYVWRGVTINDDFNVQSEFTTDLFDGMVELGVWSNFNTDENEFDEIEFFLGIPLPLGEDSPVDVEVLYSELTFPFGGGKAERQLGLGVGTEVQDIALGAEFWYYLDSENSGTFYIGLSAGYELALAENIDLGLGAVLHYWNFDDSELDSGFNAATFSATLGVVIPEIELPVSFGISYILEIDEDVAPVDEDFYFTIGFSL
jgi:hypothetical protein